jgi:hypothetical protein
MAVFAEVPAGIFAKASRDNLLFLRRCRKVIIMKRAWIASVICGMGLLVCAVPCLANVGVHPLGYVESNSGTKSILCDSGLQESMLPGHGYICLSNGLDHSNCGVFSHGSFIQFEMYVWMLPSSTGIIAGEFEILYPADVIASTVTTNPDITVVLGQLNTGTTFAFGTCHVDWVWSHHQTCYVFSNAPEFIQVAGDPASGTGPQYATCEVGYPLSPFIVLGYLGVNAWCSMCPPEGTPSLMNVTVESPTVIHAFFDMPASCQFPASAHFFLRSGANQTDTIRCTLAEHRPNAYEYVLTLKNAMVDNTRYILKALKFNGPNPSEVDSEWEFTFYEPVSTFLQGCSGALRGTGVELMWELSEVDAGIEFFVSRSENGAAFIPLDMVGLARNGLAFRYADSRVEPGKSYVYKVEYSLGGTSRLLFISEEIRTPAALLALHQNHPNPFNPSTTISFTLPAGCAVRLDVYDVSGRLVRRLIDGERRGAGLNDVEWNGRDASGGAAVSGIYVYRLVAGKETLSRKMVLIR